MRDILRDGRRSTREAVATGLVLLRAKLVLQRLGELAHEHRAVLFVRESLDRGREDLDCLVAVAGAARERVKERLGESEETEPDNGARSTLDPFDDALHQVGLGRELSGQSRRAADELSGCETGGLDPVSERVTRTVPSERHAYLVQRLNKVSKDSCSCLAHHIDQGFDSGGLEQGSLDASRLFLKPAARFVSYMASHALEAKGAHQAAMASRAGFTQNGSFSNRT